MARKGEGEGKEDKDEGMLSTIGKRLSFDDRARPSVDSEAPSPPTPRGALEEEVKAMVFSCVSTQTGGASRSRAHDAGAL